LIDVPDEQDELLTEMKPGRANEVRRLLQYPKHSAGRLMTERFITVTPAMSAAEVLDHMRRVHSDVETFSDGYVMADDGISQESLRCAMSSWPIKKRLSGSS